MADANPPGTPPPPGAGDGGHAADPAAHGPWEDGTMEDELGPFLFDLLYHLDPDRRDDALKLFRPPPEEALDDRRLERPPPTAVEPWPELKRERVLNGAHGFEESRVRYRLLAWILAIFLLVPAAFYLVGVVLLFVVRRLLSPVIGFARRAWYSLRRPHGINPPMNTAILLPSVLKTHWKPWILAHTWALYFLYVVVFVRVPMRGGFKGMLLPSKSPGFLHGRADALTKGETLVRSAREELTMAKQLHNITIRRRGEALRAALVASEIDDDEGFDRAFNKFEARQKAAGSAKQALRDAQELVIHAKQVVKTQGSAAATGYLGIADWAQDAYDSYDNLMTAITGVSFVGAGLTYGAIFSATRGSIGLMAWAFSLFIVGLAIVIPVQALLRWCSRLDNYPFSTPRVWELFLAVGVYGASASAFAAISLLVVTVLSLHFNVTSEPYNNSNAANWDAHLEFDVSPGPSAKFAFAFIGLGILGVVLVFAFFAGANGMNVFLWRRSMMRKHKMLDRIEDLEKQITGVPLGGDAEKAEIATVD